MTSRLSSLHPLRPKDWRFRRALTYVSRDLQPKNKHEDQATLEIIEFLNALHKRAAVGGRKKWKVLNEYRFQWVALDIYCDRKSDLRAIIEARILAREAAEDIGNRTGISEQIITMYAQMFFDVADRLDCPDYIHAQVLREEVRTDNRGDLLRRIGYSAGTEALDKILHTSSKTENSTEHDPLQKLSDCVDAELLMAALAAAHRVDPSDIQSAKLILQTHQRKQSTSNEGDSLSSYEKNIDAFLQQFEWSMADDDMPEEMEKWYAGPVELNADESAKGARG